jgi:hypothetical protein
VIAESDRCAQAAGAAKDARARGRQPQRDSTSVGERAAHTDAAAAKQPIAGSHRHFKPAIAIDAEIRPQARDRRRKRRQGQEQVERVKGAQRLDALAVVVDAVDGANASGAIGPWPAQQTVAPTSGYVLHGRRLDRGEQHIRPLVAAQNIVTRPALELVIPRSTRKRIGARPAQQPVRAGVARQPIAALATGERLDSHQAIALAAATSQLLRPQGGHDGPAPSLPRHPVDPGPAVEDIGFKRHANAVTHHVAPTAPRHHISARPGDDQVKSVAADHHISAGTGVNVGERRRSRDVHPVVAVSQHGIRRSGIAHRLMRRAGAASGAR